MLEWTNETPTEAGWYWAKRISPDRYDYGVAHIVKVRWHVGRLSIENWDIPTKDMLWAGPIPVPIRRKIKRRKR